MIFKLMYLIDLNVLNLIVCHSVNKLELTPQEFKNNTYKE